MVEENMAFLQRLGEECSNWLIHSNYLYHKAVLETNKYKTADRACLQLQSLIDQYDDDEPSVAERIRFFFPLFYPPRFFLKMLLGLFLNISTYTSIYNIDNDNNTNTNYYHAHHHHHHHHHHLRHHLYYFFDLDLQESTT
jgi:hypothetical protein